MAEVLITLGIIGVLALLVISPIVKNYQKKIIETSLEKTYAELYDVVRKSQLENGHSGFWKYPTTYGETKAFVEQYFEPYFNIYEYCKPHNSSALRWHRGQGCFAYSDGNYYIWRYAGYPEPQGIGGSYRIAPKYLLEDGRSICFHIISQSNDADRLQVHYIEFIVDVNGDSGNSVMGIDVFSFVLRVRSRYLSDGSMDVSSDFMPGYHHNAMWPSSYNDVCNEGGYQLYQHSCSRILQRNNWKFPKDYPIKF